MKKINWNAIPLIGRFFSAPQITETNEQSNVQVLRLTPASADIEAVNISFIPGRFREINETINDEFLSEFNGNNLETIFEKIAEKAKGIYSDIVSIFSDLADRKQAVETLQGEITSAALVAAHNKSLEDAETALNESWARGFNEKLDAESKLSGLKASLNEAAEDFRLFVIGIAGHEKAVIKIQSKLVKIGNRVAFAIAIISFEALLGFETFQGAGTDQMALALSIAFGGAIYILSILGADKSSIVSHHTDARAVFNRNYRDTDSKRRLPENQGRDNNGKIVKFYELSDKTVKAAKRMTLALGALSIALLALRGFIIYRDETLGIMGIIGTAGLLLAAWIFYALDYVFGPRYEAEQLDEYSRKFATVMGLAHNIKMIQKATTDKYNSLMDRLKLEYQVSVANAKSVLNYAIDNFRNNRTAYEKLRRQYGEAMKSFETGFVSSCDFAINKIKEAHGTKIGKVSRASLLTILTHWVPQNETLGDREFDKTIAKHPLPSKTDSGLTKPITVWADVRKTIETTETERRRQILTTNIA